MKTLLLVAISLFYLSPTFAAGNRFCRQLERLLSQDTFDPSIDADLACRRKQNRGELGENVIGCQQNQSHYRQLHHNCSQVESKKPLNPAKKISRSNSQFDTYQGSKDQNSSALKQTQDVREKYTENRGISRDLLNENLRDANQRIQQIRADASDTRALREANFAVKEGKAFSLETAKSAKDKTLRAHLEAVSLGQELDKNFDEGVKYQLAQEVELQKAITKLDQSIAGLSPFPSQSEQKRIHLKENEEAGSAIGSENKNELSNLAEKNTSPPPIQSAKQKDKNESLAKVEHEKSAEKVEPAEPLEKKKEKRLPLSAKERLKKRLQAHADRETLKPFLGAIAIENNDEPNQIDGEKINAGTEATASLIQQLRDTHNPTIDDAVKDLENQLQSPQQGSGIEAAESSSLFERIHQKLRPRT